MEEFINLHHRSMSVKYYALKVTHLYNYDPTSVINSWDWISRFLTPMSNMVEKESPTTILYHDMYISCLMENVQKIEESSPKEKK